MGLTLPFFYEGTWFWGLTRIIPHSDLVGDFNPSEKYKFVSWDDSSQYMEK